MSSEVAKLYDDKVYQDIQVYLDDLGKYSDKTENSYSRYIKEFLEWHTEKDLRLLKEEDLDIKLNKLKEYRNYLIEEKGNSNKTVNTKIGALKGIYRDLRANRYEVDYYAFDGLRSLPEDINDYDALTIDEVETAFTLIRENEQRQPIEKSLLILIAVDTSIRKNALLNLKWKDVKRVDGVYRIHVKDKGRKEDIKKISNALYEELLTIKKNDSEYVFNLTNGKVRGMMERLNKWMDFGDRNIVFHSFKKTGVTFVWKITKDVMMTMKQGNHSNFNTTKGYIKEDENPFGAISLLREIDPDKEIEEATHEELLKVIKKLDKGTQYVIASQLKEINQ